MRNRYVTIMMAALLLLPGTNGWSAQSEVKTDGQCLTKLEAKVQPGQWLRVTAHDGDRRVGRLGSIDFAHSQLMLTPLADTSTPGRTYEFNEIAKLQYRTKGKVKPGYLVGGLLFGVILGGAIGTATVDSHSSGFADFSELEAGLTGAAVGGGVGLITGLFLSTSTASTYTIKCR